MPDRCRRLCIQLVLAAAALGDLDNGGKIDGGDLLGIHIVPNVHVKTSLYFYVAADESRTSGYHYIPFEIHMSYFLIRLIRYWPYWFFIIGCASSSSFCASIHP